MGESYSMFPKKHSESIFGGITAGFFFLLVGAIFIITPNLFQLVIDFFQGFDLVTIPNTAITTFAPVLPRTHLTVYRAFEEFSFAFGIFQIVILALRFIAGSPWAKKAETASNFVFWVGAGYLTLTILIQTTRWPALTAWFVFWAGIIMLLGLSLIIRAIILAAAYPRRTM